MLSHTEENYLKAIFKITERSKNTASTNRIAEAVNITPASVTDMLKKLADKDLIKYEKYQGATLSDSGNKLATQLIRKHRLWEVFLFEKLKFPWEEIHEIAEELEHINSDDLVTRLDNFLGNPRFDPHGDPIPNAEGKFMLRNQSSLDLLSQGQKSILVGVSEHSVAFLQHLNTLKIKLGSTIRIVQRQDYDGSMIVALEGDNTHTLSQAVAKNLLVKLV